MKKLKNNRPIIVGIFVFLGLAILVITILTLGGQKKTFVILANSLKPSKKKGIGIFWPAGKFTHI